MKRQQIWSLNVFLQLLGIHQIKRTVSDRVNSGRMLSSSLTNLTKTSLTARPLQLSVASQGQKDFQLNRIYLMNKEYWSWLYLKSMRLFGLVPSENKIKIDLRQGLIHACESMDYLNKESFFQFYLNWL
jgi:hypothetical protein